MDKIIKAKFNVIAIILIIAFCFAISPITFQNDTFYTIKIGEYISQNGITMQEPFAWHEGLSYTFPHWAYDLMIYFIYHFAGYLGIYISTIIFSSILGLVLYLTANKLNKNSLTAFILSIGAMYCLKDFVAARAQLFTFIFFGLTIFFIEQFLSTKKKRYALGLIIIPIVIANFHSAVFPFYFILFLPYIAEYIIALLPNSYDYTYKIILKMKLALKSKKVGYNEKLKLKLEDIEKQIEKNKTKPKKEPYKIIINKNNNVKYLIIIMIIAMFTGLLTPIGLTPYTYLIKTMEGNTTQNINEHLALVLINNIDFLVILTIFLAILIFTDTKIRLCDFFMILGLLFLSLYTRRQTSMFIIICYYILNRLICDLFNKYDPEGTKKMIKKITEPIGLITVITIIAILVVKIYGPKKQDVYVDENAYPVKASEYILNNLDIENIRLYNAYNYGSYLLFKGIPVFIDSRADLYSPEFNKGVNIFNDFLTIDGLNTSDIESKLDEYKITHLIIYNSSKLKIYIDQREDLYKKIYPDNFDNKDKSFSIYERI